MRHIVKNIYKYIFTTVGKTDDEKKKEKTKLKA